MLPFRGIENTRLNRFGQFVPIIQLEFVENLNFDGYLEMLME